MTAGSSTLDLIRRRSRRMRPLSTGVKEQGRLPRTPRAVFFDVYGTLLVRADDEHLRQPRVRRAVESLIQEHRLPLDAAGLAAALQDAVRREHSVLRSRGLMHPEVNIESIWAGAFPGRDPEEIRATVVEYELAVHPAWPMPGCRRLLASLARRGMRLGIISNAQFYTPLVLEALLGADAQGLGFLPQLCLYSCDLGFAKPDPAVFRAAAARLAALGIEPTEAVMVGNSPAEDIDPAAGQGFMTVLAALDRRSFTPPGPQAPAERPHAVIGQLASLEKLLSEHVQRPRR